MPLHLVLVNYLYDQYGGTLYGIALATNISFFLNFAVLHVYITYITRQPYKFNPVKGLSVKRLKRSVREYLRLGFPSALMTYFDFWIYTVLLLLSSYLGFYNNAAQVILFNIASAVYAVGLGFGQAICTLVGNNVGKGKINNAKRYIAIGMIQMQALNCLFSFTFIINPDMIINFYSFDPITVEKAREPLRLIAVGNLIDSVQLMFQGAIRGLGL